MRGFGNSTFTACLSKRDREADTKYRGTELSESARRNQALPSTYCDEMPGKCTGLEDLAGRFVFGG